MLKRILMNAADQGGGGTGQPAGGNAPPAAAPAPTPAPASPPQAQGATAPDPALVAAIATAVTGTVRDSLFADMRRAGVFPQGKSKPQPTADNGTATPAQPAAPDLSRLRTLDRVLTRTGLANTISEQQYGRLERDYVAEAPEDVERWVAAYFPAARGGATSPQAPASPASAPAATPAAPYPATPQPGNALPVSDRGSSPVPSVPLEERQLLQMTPAERDELRARKGDAFFARRLTEQIRNGGVRVSLKP